MFTDPSSRRSSNFLVHDLEDEPRRLLGSCSHWDQSWRASTRSPRRALAALSKTGERATPPPSP